MAANCSMGGPMIKVVALCILTLLSQGVAGHSHDHSHLHKHHRGDGDDDRFTAQELKEMREAQPESASASLAKYGMYDMRGNNLKVLDTPQKMDLETGRRMNLRAVNAASQNRNEAEGNGKDYLGEDDE